MSNTILEERLLRMPDRPRPRPPESRSIREAAETLAESLEGEVRFDAAARALYAADASNYRQPPLGVVIPRSIDDVVITVAICRAFALPILARGGGTSLAGQCCNTGVVLDFSKYLNHVLELDVARRRARVEPGTVLDTLRDAAREHGLTFGPDPATHNHNTLGGMIGNNSCGVHSVMSAFDGPGVRTSDQLQELEVLLYDGTRMRVGRTTEEELARIIARGGRRGEIYAALRDLRDRYADLIRARYPKIPRRVSGYNLDDLLPENGFNVAGALAGTECTCVTITEATLTLIEAPAATSLVVLGYPSVYEAADHVPEILSHRPIGLEALDDRLVAYMEQKGLHTRDLQILPKGKGWLLVEFGGHDAAESEARAREVMQALERAPNTPTMRLFQDPAETAHVWAVREAGLGATAFIPGMEDTWPGWEDSAVAPENLGNYLRDFRALLDRYGYGCSFYGHFGQGLLHTRIDFGLENAAEVARYAAFTRDAAELVVGKYGGSLSGEHGDGQARADLLPIMFGEELVEAFREFKRIWDPHWKMNPGKVVDPHPRTADLRLGADYDPWRPTTHFRFPEDGGDFSHAALRCVGVGECRRDEGGTMCPSYRVTHEEMHTTRGRAHLFFEMLQGDVITDGWRSPEVKEALDLCLSCKGCKGDCPVNVDIATYKAEFLSHHYARRLRPRSAYAFGLVQYWAKLGAMAPDLTNLITHTPGLANLTRWIAGVAPQREIPAFAPRTFRDWWRSRPPRNDGMPQVILWPDTFNDHFYPTVLQSAVDVLEHARRQIVVPERWLCCGRPLYDYGMLDLAKWQLHQILDDLRPHIRAGIPVVGMEPSCVAVFRDELMNLLPEDPDARRLSEQTFTLAEFLTTQVRDYEAPTMPRHALLHGHCHHKAIMKLDAEHQLYGAMGLDLHALDNGCCGMAGSFGFEAGKYDISVAVAEHELMPAVRDAAADTLIIADGFSCREQIRMLAGRRALHTAEVMRMALFHEPAPAPAPTTSRLLGALALGGALVLGTAALRRLASSTHEHDGPPHEIETPEPRLLFRANLGSRVRHRRRGRRRAPSLR